MSLQNAMHFIAGVRRDSDLAVRIKAATTVDAICAIAADRGLPFSHDEFEKAFVHDWSMRRIAAIGNIKKFPQPRSIDVQN